MRARPTTYRGIRMRSRLEAAYAASLHGLATWEYEPECFADETGQYLPDFRVWWGTEDFTYVEIKPTPQQVGPAARRMDIILASHPDACLNVTIPTGTWPNVDFVSAAWRAGAGGRWTGPAFGDQVDPLTGILAPRP